MQKFDFRVYVTVTSIDPMEAYIANDGLVRFCTEKYDEKAGLDNLLMHLTNYSLNKQSSKFVKATSVDDQESNKQTISSVLEQLPENEGEHLKEQIKELCSKTLLALQPFLILENEIHFSGLKKKKKGKCF